MSATSDALARGSRVVSAALKKPGSALLGGDEPAKNRTKRKKKNGSNGRDDPRPQREHDRDNGKVVTTCALPAGQGRGPSIRLRPTIDPFDRAHTLRNQVTNALLAAAGGGKRMRPFVLRDIAAEPRCYPDSMLKTVRVFVRVPTEDGEEMHRVLGEVGPDSQTEMQAEYADRVAAETGVNLYGGNMASMVQNALARGGADHISKKTRRARESE